MVRRTRPSSPMRTSQQSTSRPTCFSFYSHTKSSSSFKAQRRGRKLRKIRKIETREEIRKKDKKCLQTLDDPPYWTRPFLRAAPLRSGCRWTQRELHGFQPACSVSMLIKTRFCLQASFFLMLCHLCRVDAPRPSGTTLSDCRFGSLEKPSPSSRQLFYVS